MELVTTILMAAWIWFMMRGYVIRLFTDWFIHLTLVPLLAYGCWHTPPETRNILAVAGGLMVLQLLTGKELPPAKSPVKRRTSNIPPPP